MRAARLFGPGALAAVVAASALAGTLVVAADRGVPRPLGDSRKAPPASITAAAEPALNAHPAPAAAIGYTPPVVRPGVLARLEPGAWSLPIGSSASEVAIEAPRGTLVYLFVSPILDREGMMTVAGGASAPGQTQLRSWRLRHGSQDGPPGEDTPNGASASPGTPLLQQWNSPDAMGSMGPEPYALEIDLAMRTRYPDGATRDWPFSGAVAVTVGFAASSG